MPWLAAAAGLSPADATAVAEALSAALAERSTAEVTHALQQAGVGAHEVLTTEQVMTSEPARKLGLSLTQRSEEFGPVVMPGLTVRLSESPLVLGRPAGRAGSDAESILAEVGLAGRMAELSRFWVLRTPIICRPPGKCPPISRSAGRSGDGQRCRHVDVGANVDDSRPVSLQRALQARPEITRLVHADAERPHVRRQPGQVHVGVGPHPP